MAKILVYASPSRGHVYPLMPALQELVERDHQVFARAGCAEVKLLQKIGVGARPIDEAVEFAIREDWQYPVYEEAMRELLAFLVRRAPYEARDFKSAIEQYHPDLLLVDAACMGAATVASASGLPWMAWSSELVPFPASGLPPFGLGLPLKQGAFGALKNWSKAGSIQRVFEESVEDLNLFRAYYGQTPLSSLLDWPSTFPDLIYYTIEPIEYPRPWPSSVHLVGPNIWEPEIFSELPLEQDSRPIILVSCACEYQNDSDVVNYTLQALNSSVYQIVVTSAAVSPQDIDSTPGVKVVSTASHNKILEKAACLVCTGGMGLVQKALWHGVPVCVLPRLRDQIELGERLNYLECGTSLPLKQLSPANIESKVKKAISCKGRALALQEQLRLTDSTRATVELIESCSQAGNFGVI